MRVLVVDDHQELLSLVSQALERDGHVVRQADDVARARRCLEEEEVEVTLPEPPRRTWPPGADVVHDEMGPGWVLGSGSGVVTVRFETAETPPGPVRSFRMDDPALHRWEPPPEE